jgi:hypothetical protein
MHAVAHKEIAETFAAPTGAAYVIADPLRRPDWDTLVAAHPQSTIFHGAGWARVMCDSYGHVPHYVCRFEGQALAEMLPILEVSSPWKGRRGVSLPFTDLCAPLSLSGENHPALYDKAVETGRGRNWKYLECRSPGKGWTGVTQSVSFFGHAIDLSPGADGLFKKLEGSIRRGIRKAEASGLQADFATSLESVKTYYGLHCRTRRRHGLPPQPFRFFENIQRHVLDKGQGFVATVRLKNRPVAAGVFLCHGRQAFYKFGASDFDFQEFRPNNLMMWQGILQSAQRGYSTLHLGRTSVSNTGLRRFKLSFGAAEETVSYCQYDFSSNGFVSGEDGVEGWFNHVFSRLPLPLLRLAGQILYPHLS